MEAYRFENRLQAIRHFWSKFSSVRVEALFELCEMLSGYKT